MQPYQETIEKLCTRFDTNIRTGLTFAQYQEYIKKYGTNRFRAKKISSIVYIFLSQFQDHLTYMLFAAAGVIFFAGHNLDACIIMGILIFNGVLGTIQEKRTEKILHNLQVFFECTCFVIRQGEKILVSNEFIVPGDIITIYAGEKVPADARLIEAINLTIDESSLTGESQPVTKYAMTLDQHNLPLHEQKNILFAGTYLITGYAKAIVFATGHETQAGKIYQAAELIDTNTPLKKELETLSSWLLYGILFMCLTLFIIGLVTHTPFLDLIVMLTALFICVIPEGLPVVLSIIFISGAYKMAQKNVLVKRLRAVEALGKVDVIITDKTGTLTSNQMMVTEICVNTTRLKVTGLGYDLKGSIENQKSYQTVLEKIACATALLNQSYLEYNEKLQTFAVKGNPTEAAAFILAQKINPFITTEIKKYNSFYRIPFDSQYKYSAVFCQHLDKQILFIIGAPEVILPACRHLDSYVYDQLTTYASQGLRVVAVAQKYYEKKDANTFQDFHQLGQENLEFLALLAIADEPKKELPSVMQTLQKAGIQIIMATGDHADTALYVAQKIGMIEHEKDVISGQEFKDLSDEEIYQRMHDKNFVCARFLPEQKLRLVNIFHTHNRVVVTTGDGINDVPALMASDVSIAMGSRGAELTKQTADIVLLNDAFENILYAMQEGKAMFYRLRRTLLYFLVSNTSEVFIIFFALLCKLPMPLLPSQILLLNLLTDGFLDAALAAEPTHTNTIQLKSKKNLRIFDTPMIYKTLWLALPASIISFVLFISIYKDNITHARTLTLLTLTCFQWFNALNCRAEDKSLFEIGLFSNFWFVLATAGILLLQLCIIYTPIMHYIFKTTPLHLYDWIYAVCIASTIFVAEELRKHLLHRTQRSEN